MKRLLAITLAAMLAVSGCNYKVGDGTKRVLELQKQYCENADPAARLVLLGLARKVDPNFPEDGLCTDLVELLYPEKDVPK